MSAREEDVVRIIKFMGLKLTVLCLALALAPSLSFALTAADFQPDEGEEG